MTGPEPKVHHYVSTACLHGLCDDRCRATCKFCDAPCEHDCHRGGSDSELPPPWVDQARDVARRLLTAVEIEEGLEVTDPDLHRRVREDPALFWLRGEEQQPGEWRPITREDTDHAH